MRTRGKRVRAFINFIFVIAVVGLALVGARSLKAPAVLHSTATASPTPSLSVQSQNSFTPTPTATETPAPATKTDLVVLETGKSGNKLVRINRETQARTTVFTDTDEPLKIKQVGNLTLDGGEALVLMGSLTDDFGGSLYSVTTDGSGQKQLLVEQFASPWPPVFSPDGSKIAYVYFSNAEADIGFYLVVANRDGTNKRELVTEKQAITQPVFSPNGTEVAYIRSGVDSGSGSIMAIGISGGNPRQLATYAKQVPYDLAWGPGDALVYVDGVGDLANIYEYTNGSAVKIVTPSGSESRPVYSPDGEFLAFASSGSGNSTINIYERTTAKTTKLGAGSMVLGWAEGRG